MSEKIIVVIGTRPEAIKLAPVIKALQKRKEFEVKVCFTGQHRELALDILTFFEISPDINFDLMGKTDSLVELSSELLKKFNQYFLTEKPQIILVQGDTTTALMAAVAAYYLQIKIGHVEAGLRTRNRFSPWPEEGNRTMLSTIADWHFAPTEQSAKNLIEESVPADTIFITGNTVIDALLDTVGRLPDISHGESARKMILITNHRRENLGKRLDQIFTAISELSRQHPDVDFVFPIHPNPVVQKQARSILGDRHPNVQLIEPQEYPDFVTLMKDAYFILTDSGGIQEEAPALGKPVLVTRDTTERPEGVTAGTARLVGVNKEDIIRHCNDLLTNDDSYNLMSKAQNPYGDGTSAERIADILGQKL